MVGVMFKPNDKIIFNGGDNDVYVSVGSKGTIIKKEGDLCRVRFEGTQCGGGTIQVCDSTSLSYYFSINDNIKVIGPINGPGTHDGFLGFEGTVINVDPIEINLPMFGGGSRDLRVEISSLEKLESIVGSKWWV